MAGSLPNFSKCASHAQYPGSTSLCHSCHMSIVAKECVKCPEGRTYHRFCLMQKSIGPNITEGLDCNYLTSPIKAEKNQMEMTFDLLQEPYNSTFIPRESVKLFSMSDDDFVL